MRTTWLLRLTLAVIFALIAFIFSEVIPDIPPVRRIYLRIFVTVWAGLLGYGLFPDVAKIVTMHMVQYFNLLSNRITNEIVSRMDRFPMQNHHQQLNVPTAALAPVGGVSFNQPLILDTSAIIDGRILDIAKTHFIFGTVIIPEFVLVELQQVADSSDFLKRNRGRKGFEVISALKKIKGIRIEVWDKDAGGRQVDDKLIKLAKSLHGRIVTTDYNLNQVASVSGVLVLNINDLANSLKTIAIPGEKLTIKVIHLGKDETQGVGYLSDGTMVVVKDGSELLGKDVEIEVTRIIQIPAGRMIFGKALL
jgi:uncharacterized protein YacL